MRQLAFTSAPPPNDVNGAIAWLISAVREIELASHDRILEDEGAAAAAAAITSNLGAAVATTYNGLTITTTTGTLTVAAGKTLTLSNTVTLTGTDGSTLNFGTGGTLGSLAFASSVAGSALTGTTLANGIVTSSLTAVGTLGTGVWNATTIGVAYGGTGKTTYTKGDLLVTPGSTTLNLLAVGSDGQVLTADAASTNGVKWATPAATWTRSNSTADQSFTNSTFADLTNLTFAVGANKNYIFQATLFVSAGTTGGIKVGITTPSSPTSFTAGGYAAGNSSASNVVAANAVSGGATVFSNAGAGWALAVIHIRGVIRNVNAGTVAIQGAQNTTNGTATVFQRGSYIEYSEIT